MKLKRVKISGFKTFADKTEFELNGDIVAVVGPNGCGKSNIVDSVLWGLGESNVRTIRAQSGKEVIFAGSALRKAHGFAEVHLTFDNEDGGLPIDSPEVTISRRVDRSGQSDYEINRRSCRLKDVADLLADSGLGRAGYAIVGQSEIDQALAASPQQRRAWIDEAAGVHRYRIRRQESIRRLDAATQHLTRVHDVIRELDAQREPLAEEAEVAMRYKSAAQSLRQVECGLLIQEISELVAELETLESAILSAQKIFESESKIGEEAEKRQLDLATEAQKLESEAEGLRKDISLAKDIADQISTSIQIAQSKLEHLDLLESNLEAEQSSAQDRVSHAEQDLVEAKKSLESEETQYERLQVEMAGSGDEAKQLQFELSAIEDQLIQARKSLADRQRAELERAHQEQRLREIKKELSGIVKTLPDLATGIEDAEKDLLAKQTSLGGQREQLKALDEQIQAQESSVHHRSNDLRNQLSQLAALDGKRRGIEATIEANEGLAQGSRAVLSLVKQKVLPNHYVPVGSVIKVDAELALAIDTALGAAANDLIVPDESFAKQAIAHLRDQSLGRATFQPLTLMKSPQSHADDNRLTKRAGVLGFASKLVQCEDKFLPVIESLLGRVLITESLDDALAMTKTSGWSRCVSLTGEIVHSSGAVTGGRNVRQVSGLVQRQSELREALKDIKSLQESIDKLQIEIERSTQSRIELQAQKTELGKTLEPVLLEVEDSKSWLSNLKMELASTERAKSKLETEINSLEHPTLQEGISVDVEKIEEQRDEVWKRFAARSADIETANQRLAEAHERLRQSQSRVKECERRLESIQESEVHRSRRMENVGPEREKYKEVLQQALGQQSEKSNNLERLRSQLETCLENRKQCLGEVQRLSEEVHQSRKSQADAQNMGYQAELKKARLDAKKGSTLERLLDEYGVNEESALDRAPGIVVPKDAVTLVNRLRREIKDMGDVNLGAIEAYERLSERFDELSYQATDIESGMSEIREGIRELDKVTKEKFEVTFQEVKQNFREMFSQIFGGGEGTLELVESENERELGVDISVTVPGKRKQRLELLSGGERAMSAIAFLFALLKTKPSPLVILDEIDAPLDGRNVERFIGLMRKFCEQIQFILVTHNPMTIESADVWFGVTMQEPGVSTLVPFKVPDKASVKAVVPDVYLKG